MPSNYGMCTDNDLRVTSINVSILMDLKIHQPMKSGIFSKDHARFGSLPYNRAGFFDCSKRWETFWLQHRRGSRPNSSNGGYLPRGAEKKSSVAMAKSSEGWAKCDTPRVF